VKFTKVSIDGYGRFKDREVEISPGLQVVAGPNEQGKSTLRHFIGDMLYGQKRSTVQRLYDESNHLRAPWDESGGYGGRIWYALDSNREFEIHRNFSREKESIQVFDRTDAQDITGDFTTLRNRESTFAERHLGMTKEVFLAMATISHVSLDELGNKQALIKIREKLLSLTDSGTGESSAESAIKRLMDRIYAIGQNAARTKPLPMARARLVDLQKEHEQVEALREEINGIEVERHSTLRALADLAEARTGLEKQLAAHDRLNTEARLDKAEALKADIDAMTAASFESAYLREFPLDSAPEVRRAATLMAADGEQIKRTESERDELASNREKELERLGPDGAVDMAELDPAFEERLAELDSRTHWLSDRLEQLTEGYDTAKRRHEEAREDLDALPDFSRLAADPVTWLTQLASEFAEARNIRDDRRIHLTELGKSVERTQSQLEEPNRLFADVRDLPAVLREYEVRAQTHKDELEELRAGADDAATRAALMGNRVPGFAFLVLLCASAAAVTGAVAVMTGNYTFFFPSGISGAGLVTFTLFVFLTVQARNKALFRLERAEDQIAKAAEEDEKGREFVEALMVRARSQTPRELEARHERYQHLVDEFVEQEEEHAEALAETREAEQNVDRMYGALAKYFAKAGDDVQGEGDVQPAAMRAIGRYQEYRDAKRRASESAEALERRRKELDELTTQLDALREEELELSLKVRQTLRENHYADEQKADTALKALRGYRIRSAQNRQRRGEVAILEGSLQRIERQIESENSSLSAHAESLEHLLKQAGVASLKAFEAEAEKARAYAEKWSARKVLEERLATLLEGTTLAELRAQVKSFGPLPEQMTMSMDDVKGRLASLQEEVEAKQKQEHALHISTTERNAGSRSLNEVEEERAATEAQVRELELELQAASHASSMLEEVTRERHSRIAPHLAELSSEYLKEITGGAYDELLVNRDMQISIRIPQTKALNEAPESQLSKGTVDQIYLALRLAMVQCISEYGERIPMLLDDPFANYDDARLSRAMELLYRISLDNQILLFTCRRDVVRAAKNIDVPVIRL
jgi:uncharacterized protein YhaN